MSKCTPKFLTSQEFLFDPSTERGDNLWRLKKRVNEYLAFAFGDINSDKAARLTECSTLLQFGIVEDSEKKRLMSLNSCRVRLCPICQWRRSLKAFYNTLHSVTWLQNSCKGGYRYIFLTLTVKNCSKNALVSTIDELNEAFNRFAGYKAVKGAFCGWVRTLEVTHNLDYASKDFDTYHPHYHLLVAVKPHYFKHESYLSKSALIALWRKAARLDYDPSIDVKAVQAVGTGKEFAKMVAEVSKYATKDADYMCYDDWDLTVDTVSTLDAALANRRLIAYSGVFAEAHRKLQLDDADDGDLVNVDGDELNAEDIRRVVWYAWNSGYSEYVKVSEAEK